MIFSCHLEFNGSKYIPLLSIINFLKVAYSLQPTTMTNLPVLNHLFESQGLHTLTFGFDSENIHY